MLKPLIIGHGHCVLLNSRGSCYTDHLTRPAHRLLEEHIDDVVDVPAKLSARVRALGHGHGRKTDAADAVSTAIAARTTAALQRISPEQPAHAPTGR
jgi:hypothetical protein